MPRLRDFPLLVILWLGASLLTFVPAVNAVALREWEAARVFLYHGTFFLLFGMMVGIGASGYRPRLQTRYQLLSLLGVFVLFPAFLALPMAQLVPSMGFSGAYFEALSALTTTGATVIADPDAVVLPVHLWRSLIGWMGGFLVLLAAVAIVEPLNLGGFEVAATVDATRKPMLRSRGGTSLMRNRLLHHARVIAPIYAVATLALTLGLIAMGEEGLVATCHAMAVLSTSGISPVGGFPGAQSGAGGEALVVLFLVLAVTHRGFAVLQGKAPMRDLQRDRELRFAIYIVAAISGVLFLRHFVAAVEIDEQTDFSQMIRALWGVVFTVISFLTTLGMESVHWKTANDWTGLDTSGVILLGLAMMGGGVATTAGGVKLMRVYALYKHSLREMDRLVLPRSVGGAGITARRIRREGAFVAWIFLMLFFVAAAIVQLALSLAGQSFDASLALSMATLSNTGPAAEQMLPDLSYAALDGPVRAILCVAMIVGRLEALVVVALFNPSYWRDG